MATDKSIKVSVRTDSGGHCFSPESLPAKAGDEGVEVEFVVITPKTVLVPSEFFDESAAERYLSMAGAACASDECPLCITEGEKVAVLAVAKSFLSAVTERFGGRALFASPLLSDSGTDGRRLHIATFGEVSFFRLCANGELRFAEALRCADGDEILYYVQMLNDRFDLDNYLIYICGDRSQESAELLKQYFKRVKCE